MALVAVVTVAVVLALGAARAQAAAFGSNRNPCGLETVSVDVTSNLYRKCLRTDKRVGYCLNDYQCWENGTISCSVEILDDEERTDESPMPESECGDNYWCCYDDYSSAGVTLPELETTTKSGSETTTKSGSETTTKSGSETTTKSGSGSGTSQCLLYYEDGECPWCVALYRPGGDVLRGQRQQSGLYCAGAMVSPRVVLTSATCVRTVADEAIWARVPESADPARQYSVVEKIKHPNYDTGTHENDFGLLVLKEDVQWADGPAVACVGRNTVLSGKCFVVGFDESDAITMTPVSVNDGDCPRKRPRNLTDVACATSTDTRCHVVPGAALLCLSISDGQGGLEIAGVARKNCIAGKALLGKLQPHADWFQGQLRRLGQTRHTR